ncbi:MAG: AAA family ATPase [Halioglobus sp.]|nr:AAA family ATPase [Halioglobus sp.]
MHGGETLDKNQRTLIDALRDPSVFGSDRARFDMIETHISWVFLCGGYAYKIKKALNLGFLDFSTLQRRRFYCHEELRLNGRLAPGLYLAVVPITGTPAQPRLGGAGAPFEYAVKMRRFEQKSLLSALLKRGSLSAAHIDEIIALVADFHQRIAAAAAGDRYGEPEQVVAPARENVVQIRQHALGAGQARLLDDISHWCEQQHRARRDDLQARKAQGFIRECHGDMHLGNMAVIDGRVVIFDGIEFNPDLYWIDVISEAAFVCMDLDHHHRQALAWRFWNGYFERTGDYAGLRVARYYLVYRAMVRAKIAWIRLHQETAASARPLLEQRFDNYLQLARSYTRPRPPVLLITHGLSGSGKSTLTGPLSEQWGAIRVRSDRERQRLAGGGIPADAADEPVRIGQGRYSSDTTAQTYDRLAQLAQSVVASGYNVIIDAAFLERRQRDQFRELAARLGVPMRILHCRAAADVLSQRVRQRRLAGRDISEADLRVLAHQLATYRELGDDERDDTVTVDTQAAHTAKAVLELLQRSL